MSFGEGGQALAKRWIRKEGVGRRYGGISTRTVDRHVIKGLLPAPVYLNGSRYPLWCEDELDDWDRKAASKERPPRPVAQPATEVHPE
jgi:hypothetical protein